MKKIEDYTRVTAVLYPFSGLKKINPDVLKNAAERGTRAHKACEAIVKNLGYFDDDETISGYVESFKIWCENKTFIPTPQRFYCDDLMITGECDLIYEDERGLVLVDLKTPAKESKQWLLQGSAYSYLAKKAGYEIKAIEFVKLSKEGKAAQVFHYEEKFSLFNSHLEAYRYSFEKEEIIEELDYL